MPTLRPRKRASASSSSCAEILRPRPERRRCRAAPARPRPSAGSICPSRTGRPGRPPRRVPIFRSMSLRICTRAAPRPSDRFTPESRMAGAIEVCVHAVLSCARSVVPAGHMGSRAARSSGLRRWRSRHCFALIAGDVPATRGDKRRIVRCRSWRSAIRSAPASGLRRRTRFRRSWSARSRPRGIAVDDRECRRLGRHRVGRARAARLVGGGRHRRRDPRTRRQRRAARRRSEGDARLARGDHHAS